MGNWSFNKMAAPFYTTGRMELITVGGIKRKEVQDTSASHHIFAAQVGNEAWAVPSRRYLRNYDRSH